MRFYFCQRETYGATTTQRMNEKSYCQKADSFIRNWELLNTLVTVFNMCKYIKQGDKLDHPETKKNLPGQ